MSQPEAYLPLFPYMGAQKDSIIADGELVVVNFAGIGGACEGLKAALGRPPTHAINHSPIAINLHRRNMPHTTHHVQDVWQIDPEQLVGSKRIAVAWFSPDCKHFSKAKGGVPREQNIRDLAWVTRNYTRLSDDLKPRCVFLENVEEFLDWGPLDENGYPVKARKGETFREFVQALIEDGYEVEWKLLKACDYGAPTTRKRLFLIARCDGAPIVWPTPTHGDPKTKAVQDGKLLPWRTAAECIDWTIPCPSIFERQKPLVDNTLRRVARGLKRYVIESKEPFIVTCNHGGEGFRGQSIHEPLKTITAAYDATGVVDPLLTPFLTNKQFGSPERPVTAPMSTITTNHNKQELVAPYLVPRLNERQGQPPRAVAVNQPMPTVTTTANAQRLAAPLLVKSGHYSNKTGEGSHFRGQRINKPISTIVSSGNNPMLTNAELVQAAWIAKHRNGSTGSSLDEPIHTITAGGGTPQRMSTGNPMSLVSANLIHFYGQKSPSEVRGQALSEPLKTQTTENRHGLVAASLVQHYGGFYSGSGIALDQPLNAITSVDHHALMCAYLVRKMGKSKHGGLIAATDPMPTVMTGGGGKIEAVVVTLAENLIRHGHDVYELMCRFAPEALTERDHEHRLVFVTVAGVEYFIADVGMRMLVPRELARGQSFDDEYELEEGADGKPISKTEQIKGIGNSVCPVVAEQLARANLVSPHAAD